MNTKRMAFAGTALAAALMLSACGTSGADGSAASAASSAAEHAESSVTIDDQWVKAAESGGMTGLFGTLRNTGDHDLVINGVESRSADMIELHEVTSDGLMQQIEGDVVIPAGGSYELAPGANHIMLMGLTEALLAGDDVTVTVRFDDGSSLDITAPVKDYAGANESYDDLGEHDSHGEHSGHDAADEHGGH